MRDNTAPAETKTTKETALKEKKVCLLRTQDIFQHVETGYMDVFLISYIQELQLRSKLATDNTQPMRQRK